MLTCSGRRDTRNADLAADIQLPACSWGDRFFQSSSPQVEDLLEYYMRRAAAPATLTMQ